MAGWMKWFSGGRETLSVNLGSWTGEAPTSPKELEAIAREEKIDLDRLSEDKYKEFVRAFRFPGTPPRAVAERETVAVRDQLEEVLSRLNVPGLSWEYTYTDHNQLIKSLPDSKGPPMTRTEMHITWDKPDGKAERISTRESLEKAVEGVLQQFERTLKNRGMMP